MISVGTIKTPTKKGDQVTVYFKDGTSGSFIAENDLTSTKVGVIGNRAFTDAQPVVQLEIEDIFRSARPAYEEEEEECYNYFSVFVGSSTVQTLANFAGQVRTKYNGTDFLVVQLEERMRLRTATLDYKGPSEFSGSLLYNLIGVDDTVNFIRFAYQSQPDNPDVNGVSSTSEAIQFDTAEYDIIHQGNVAWGFSTKKLRGIGYRNLLPRNVSSGSDLVIEHGLYPEASASHNHISYGNFSYSASDTINTVATNPEFYEEPNPGGYSTANGSASRSEAGRVDSGLSYEDLLALGGGDNVTSGPIGSSQVYDVDQNYDFEHTGFAVSSDGIERTYFIKRKGFYKDHLSRSTSGNITITNYLYHYYDGHPPISHWYHSTFIPMGAGSYYDFTNGQHDYNDTEEWQSEETDITAVVITDFLTLENYRYEKEYRKSEDLSGLSGGSRHLVPDSSQHGNYNLLGQYNSYGIYVPPGATKQRGSWIYDPPNNYYIFDSITIETIPQRDEMNVESGYYTRHQDFQRIEEDNSFTSIINTGTFGLFRETIQHKDWHYLYDADFADVLELAIGPKSNQYAPKDPQFLSHVDDVSVTVRHNESLGPPQFYGTTVSQFHIDVDFYKFVYPGVSPTLVKNPGLAFFARIDLDNTAKIHNHIITNGNGSPASFTIEVDFDYSNAISSREPKQYLNKALVQNVLNSNATGYTSQVTRGTFDPEDIRGVDFTTEEFYIVTYIDSVQLFYLSRCSLQSFAHEDRLYPSSLLNEYREYEKMTFTVHQAIALDSLTFIDKRGFEKSNTDNCFIFTPEGAAVFNFINERQCSFFEDEDTGRKFICASPDPLQNLWYDNNYSWLNLDLREERYNTLVFEIQGDRIKLLALQGCDNVSNFNLFRDEHKWTQFLIENLPDPNDTVFTPYTI